MDFDETQRKKKQQYLYTEIIESGYDAALFQEFLDKKKPGGCFKKKIQNRLLKFFLIRWIKC